MFEKDSIKKISQNRKEWEEQTLQKNLLGTI